MSFLSSFVGKAILKSKANSFQKSVSDAVTTEPEDGEEEESGKRKGRQLTKEDKSNLAHYGVEFGNTVSIMAKDRKWIESVTTEEGLLVENLSLKAYPVTVYRCSGRFPCSATVRQLAQAAFALEERRRWDHELSRSSRVLEQLTDTCVVEYVSNADGALGGIVSGREYVDVRSLEARGSNGRVWWGSVEWDRSTGNEDAKLVRAWNYPQGFTFQEYEPGLFLLRLTIHRDYRGWLPYTAAESGMPQYIALLWKQFVDYVRKEYPPKE